MKKKVRRVIASAVLGAGAGLFIAAESHISFESVNASRSESIPLTAESKRFVEDLATDVYFLLLAIGGAATGAVLGSDMEDEEADRKSDVGSEDLVDMPVDQQIEMIFLRPSIVSAADIKTILASQSPPDVEQ